MTFITFKGIFIRDMSIDFLGLLNSLIQISNRVSLLMPRNTDIEQLLKIITDCLPNNKLTEVNIIKIICHNICKMILVEFEYV